MKVSECLVEPVITATNIIEYREAMRITQEEFSEAFRIPIGTLRRWEQGVSKPQISLAKLNVCNSVLRWLRDQSRKAA